ncbi:pectinesterase family protein [Sphingomonas sp. DT-204]|uniref:pectinesterase family protein n=1 Tax=Sphingomonas sp. DT-204 TaxID=3396166 RepID=UPI003F1A045A
MGELAADVHVRSVLGRRQVLAGASATALAGLAAPAAAASHDVTVATSGRRGTVPSLGEALAIAARAAGRRFAIGLDPGTYREKLSVTVPNVTLAGTRPGAVIAFAAGAALPSPEGRNWGTGGSAVLTIAAPGVTLSNLTIRNDHPYLAQPMQAVALAVAAAGERTRIAGCRIESYQDTLLLQASTQVADCRISGCVDFVFGGGAAWIERCEIVSRSVPNAPAGYIAAPSTHERQRYGLVFDMCRLTREPGVPDGSIFLGRPWRAGGNMALTGQASFLRCWMDAHIAPAGWTSMGYTDPAGVRRQLTPAEARFSEYGNRGPGAVAAPSRPQRSADAYARMTPVSILGWSP